MSEILVNTIKKADGTGSITVPAETGTVLTSGSDLTGVTGAGVPDAIDVNASAPADSLAIDASGNVGIGTSPGTKLDVHNSSFGGSATTLHLSSTNSASEVIPYAGLGLSLIHI